MIIPSKIFKSKKIAIVSGYWNPLAVHHLQYIRAASELADSLILIVNNDYQVKLKGNLPFQTELEREIICNYIVCVDWVVRSRDCDRTVRQTLQYIYDILQIANKLRFWPRKQQLLFCNGGDVEKCEEEYICDKLGIKTVYGVGGGKTGSSSKILDKAGENWVIRNSERAQKIIDDIEE